MTAVMPPKKWPHQKWGRCTDLIHQSDLKNIIGEYGCPAQFRYKKTAAAQGPREPRSTVNGKMTAGTAVHAVLHRILSSPPAIEAVMSPAQSFARSTLSKAYHEEFDGEAGDRTVEWFKHKADKVHEECIDMLFGVVEGMRHHVGEVVAVECGFVYHLNGIWVTGAVDLVYRAPGSDRLSFADWKTGANKPCQIELDHGWQSAIYAQALKDGYFVRFEDVVAQPDEEHRDALERACQEIAVAWQSITDASEERDEIGPESDALADALARHRATRFGEFPEQIRYVHLRDYIPYSRKQSKVLRRPEELAWAGAPLDSKGHKVTMEKGDARGPAWYHVNRSESDAPRLLHTVKAVISMVRFGRFPAAIGDICNRCSHRETCLNTGYQATGEEAAAMQNISRAVGSEDFDGLDEL